MTPQEMNEEIAKICGWLKDRTGVWYTEHSPDKCYRRRLSTIDWSGDLNAAMGLLKDVPVYNKVEIIGDVIRVTIEGMPRDFEVLELKAKTNKDKAMAVCKCFIKWKEGEH